MTRDAPSTPHLRWGLLGASRIARSLIPAIREAGGEVVMVGAREPQSGRVQAFARQWGIQQVGTYQDVTDAELDAVYNPLTNDQHLPWGVAAMRAGKHTLIEKPLVLDAAQAAELAQVAGQTGRVLLEAFAYRFQPHVTRVRELVQGGELGEIRAVRTGFGFRLDRPEDFRWTGRLGGGALYDVGTYTVNLIRLLLGEPQSVTAQARWRPDQKGGQADVGLSATLSYPGALASLDCAFDWALPAVQRLSVVGSSGVLDMDGVYHSYTAEPTTLRTRLGDTERVEEFAPHNGYAAMVRHFAEVTAGAPALYPPADAVAQARVLDALFASAHSGSRVEL